MKKRVVRLGLVCVAGFGLLVLLAQLSLAGGGLPCPVYGFAGLYCPVCGASRAVGSLLRLDMSAAFAYNSFAVALLLPALAVLLCAQAVRYVRGRPYTPSRAERVLCVVLIVAGLVFGVLRNLPHFAFLAPGG